MTLLNTAVYDNTLVGIIVAVKDKGFQRLFLLALRSRYIGDDAFKHLFYVSTQLCRYTWSVHSRYAYYVFDLVAGSLGVSTREVYLVYNGQHFKVMLNCKVGVCKCLSLNSL